MPVQGLLLDTCALIWTVQGSDISDISRSELQAKERNGLLFINPISAWEISMLVTKNRLSLSMPVKKWFDQIVANPGFVLAELTTDILIESNSLPGNPPKDPMDRMMIAMARDNGYKLMTRDGVILNYANQGYVHAIEC